MKQEKCRNNQNYVTTKIEMKSLRRQQKIVVTFQSFVATQYKVDGKESLLRHFKLCRGNNEKSTREISRIFVATMISLSRQSCKKNLLQQFKHFSQQC